MSCARRTPVLIFLDPAAVATQYWPDLVAMVKSRLGARSVAVINNAMRQSSTEAHSKADRMGGPPDSPRASKPFHAVHNDYSAERARNALRAILPSFFEDVGATSTPHRNQKLFMDLRREIIEAEDRAVRDAGLQDCSQWDGTRYEGPRWGIFSIWRPLEMVRSDPIGVIDATSMFEAHSTADEKRKAYTSIQLPHQDRPGFAKYFGNNVMPFLPTAERQHR